MRKILKLATWLLVIGGLALGYEGITDRDLFGTLFGNSLAATVIQISIGLSAILVAIKNR